MAPVAKRLTISTAGLTSSMGTGSSAHFSSIRPRKVSRRSFCSLMSLEYSAKVDAELARVACWSFAMLSGDQT